MTTTITMEERQTFTITATIIYVDNWLAYVSGAEMQFIPAIVTMDRLYVNGSPASSLSSTLKTILKADTPLYINGRKKTEEGYVKRCTVELAWLGKKPKNIPSLDQNFLLHNEMVKGEFESIEKLQKKTASIIKGIGKLKSLTENTAEIEIFWEPRLKMKIDVSNSALENIQKFGDEKYINFNAIQIGPTEWKPIKVWTEHAEYKQDGYEELKLPETDVPMLYWLENDEMNQQPTDGNSTDVPQNEMSKITITTKKKYQKNL